MSKLNREMKKILFANTRKFVIEEGSLDAPNNVMLAMTVNKKLEPYGMTLDASAIRALSTQTAEEMSQTWKEMEDIVKEVTGVSDFVGKELFYPNFPEEVMEKSDAELYLNSLFYYTFSQTNNELSIAIANEIRAMVTEDKKEKLPLLEEFPRELKIINKGEEKDLLKMMDARMHSLGMSEHQLEELKLFSKVYREEFDSMLDSETRFQSKESKVKIAMMLHEGKRDKELKYLLKDAVDVLRFAAMLSKHKYPGNNVELIEGGTTKIGFKLTNSEKRLIRSLLHNCNGLYADIWTQKELFNRLKEKLGTRESDGCSTRVAKAFDNLSHNKRVDENGRPLHGTQQMILDAVKKLNETGDISGLERVAKNRPGDFRVSYLNTIEKTNAQYRDRVIDLLDYCVESNSIALSKMLVMKNELNKRQQENELIAKNEPCIRVRKHHVDKTYITAAKGIKLDNETIEKIDRKILEVAGNMVKGYQELGKVFVDPRLEHVKAPGAEMRTASGGSILTKYSTIPTDKNKNLLMFGIHWESPKNKANVYHLDVDLSVHMYGKDFENLGHVSYSHLRDTAAIHSGDYTHLCNGEATEAIVVDKELLKELGVKYLTTEVHCYSIESFREAGNCRFVMEEKEGSLKNVHQSTEILNGGHRGLDNGKVSFLGEVFEPAQLDNCIQLDSDGYSCVPVYYNVDDEQFHWLDFTLGSRAKTVDSGYLRQTENPKLMGAFMKEIFIAESNVVPNMKDLFEAYAIGNGELTTDIAEADTVFTYQNVDREQVGIKEDARVISSFELDVISKEFSGNDDQSMIVKEEAVKEVKEQDMSEHPLVKQLRYLHEKITNYPMGVVMSFEHDELERE